MNRRILIATGIYPPDIGGPATMVDALVNSLRERAFDVRVLTYSEIESKNDQVVRIKKTKFKLIAFIHYFLVMLKLSFWSDLNYATDLYSVGYFSYLIKRLTGKRYIIRFAGDSAWETAVNSGWTNDYIIDFQNNKYDQRIEKLKARRQKILVAADQIIAVSNFLSRIAEQIGAQKNKITMIYNSVDFVTEKINEQRVKEVKNKFGQDAKILVTACRLTPWKGVDGVIRILPQLIKKVGLIKFLVLGDGEELPNLKKIAADEKMENNIHFLGRINHNDALIYIAAADLFVLNSNYEGLSHVLLEAIKMGVPIAASRVGGNLEVIDDKKNGLLFDYNNQDEILSAISVVLLDKDYANEIIKQAKEKLKIFSWSNNVESTIKVINEILS